MTAAIYAELSVDESRIILLGVGDIEDLAYNAALLRSLTPLVRSSTPPGALVVPASWAAVVQLSATFGTSWRPGPRLQSWITTQVRRRQPTDTRLLVPTPAGLVARPYQVRGARLIAETGRALISDEPGTGKTVTTILGLRERALETSVIPIVTVAPTSVVDSWVDHYRTWAPDWRTIPWRGSPEQRQTLVGTADVYVASYGMTRVDASGDRRDPLLALKPATVVVDEHHLVKNPRAARTTAVRRLAKHATTVVALSGTPITHHPADLWPTLTCLEPTAWPSRERWVNRYCLTTPADYGEDILGLNPGTEAEFRLVLLGQHRRVAKADVLSQLPPKIYSVRTVELPPAHRRAYDQMAKDMLASLPGGGELAVMTVLAQLTRLSQMASAAADVTVTTEVDEHGFSHERYAVTLKAPSWKVEALMEVLDERAGARVLVFAPSRQLIGLAGMATEHAGYRTGYIVGGQSTSERTRTVSAFQAGELDVICATTGAGGVGLTLTAASTVVFLQRPWSLVESLQAEDRAHRIGSERHDAIEIIDILAADTIDTRVRATLKERGQQLADLVADPRIVADLLGGPSINQRRAA